MTTINSAANGDWSVGATWSGGVAPVLGDKVNISHVVTVNNTSIEGGDDTTTAINVKSGGTLKWSRSVNSTLRARGEIVVESGGSFDMGKSADPIPSGVVATLKVNDSAALADAKYGVTINDNCGVWIYGAAKTTNTRLYADVAAAATSCEVLDATGWAVGDVIVLAGTRNSATEYEERTLTGVTPTTGTRATLTWVSGLSYPHHTNGPVGNFTNNVIITPYNTTYRSYFYNYWNTSQAANSREIRYCTFLEMASASTATFKHMGAIVFYVSSSAAPQPYISIGNIAFYQTSSGSGGCILIGNHKISLPMQDIAMYSPRDGIRAYQGGVASFTRVVTYRAGYAVAFGYSDGARNSDFIDCEFTGTSSAAIYFGGGHAIRYSNCKAYACVYPLHAVISGNHIFENCAFGGASCPGGAGFANVYLASGDQGNLVDLYLSDCTFWNGLTLPITAQYKTGISTSKIVIGNKDVDPSKQEIHTPAGSLYRDNAVYKLGTTSLRAEPYSAIAQLTVDLQVIAPTGKPVAVTGYLRKNSAYGSANRPKVTLLGLGITESSYTMADVTDAWDQFTVSGTQSTGTDGILTLRFAFQSNGAGAAAWVSGISAPPYQAVNTGEFGYWSKGQPQQLLLSTPLAPIDIFNVLSTELITAGTIGKLLVDQLNAITDVPADVLTAAQAAPIKADVQSVLEQQLTGTGTEADPWGPA